MITKLLGTFNIDNMRETIDSANNGIGYTSLRNREVLIKYGELKNDSTVEEGDLEELEEMTLNKVMKICQNLVKDVAYIKNIISKNDDTYGNE